MRGPVQKKEKKEKVVQVQSVTHSLNRRVHGLGLSTFTAKSTGKWSDVFKMIEAAAVEKRVPSLTVADDKDNRWYDFCKAAGWSETARRGAERRVYLDVKKYHMENMSQSMNVTVPDMIIHLL